MEASPIAHAAGSGDAPLALVLHLPRATAARGAPCATKPGDVAPLDRLVLPYERREKARQRARLESGREVAIRVARGTVLRGGDRMASECGFVVEIAAAPEAVSTVCATALRELARLAYHLGNRHVALEVGDGWVRYLADHVLDAMVEQLGFAVVHECAPFEPEAGAYHTHAHAQGRGGAAGLSPAAGANTPPAHVDGHSHAPPLHGGAHAHSHDRAHAHPHSHPGDHSHENERRHVFGRVVHGHDAAR
jgi:urease accessory protein